MEWFEEWFGPLYEELYAHRSRDEAREQVATLLAACGLIEGPVLDAGCGNGRHLAELLEHGLEAIGVDLSAYLLAHAATLAPGHVLRCDLRACPFPDATFALVANFFTGFGYLATPQADLDLLAELARILLPGGWLFLDLANPPHVRSHLVASDERTIGSRQVRQSRFLKDDRVEKRIELFQGPQKLGEYWERVRLWEHDALVSHAAALGLKEIASLGNLQGAPWTQESPRLSLLLRKAV